MLGGRAVEPFTKSLLCMPRFLSSTELWLIVVVLIIILLLLLLVTPFVGLVGTILLLGW